MTDRSPVLSPAQAAIYANCHAKTVLRALRRGELVGYQRGTNCSWRIYQRDLDCWIRGERPERQRRAS